MEILDTASSPENAVSFTDAEVAVVKAALKTKLFRRSTESVEVRLPKFQKLVWELSSVFGIPEVKLTVGPERDAGYCKYDNAVNTIDTEKFLSLVTVLAGFAKALQFYKPEMRPSIEALFRGEPAGGLDTMAFALSLYKAAAPRMFEEAKGRGRLMCTSVPYTDDGRLTAEAAAASESTGEDAAPEGATTDLPPAPRRPIQRQRPDVDPENRVDRGNGHGED